MKKTLTLTITAIFMLATFVACDNNDEHTAGTPGTPAVSVTGVTLNQTIARLNVGDTAQLMATVLPDNATNQNVTWSSNNTAVATVDSSGVVTAVSLGRATVTVTTQDGNHIVTCSIVIDPINIPVTGITINQTSATLEIGNTLQLTATVLPDSATFQNVHWWSSNTSVATVNQDGAVTAISVGMATITVAPMAAPQAITATSVVTVIPQIISVTGVTLNRNTAELNVGNTLQLTPTVLPTNATNRNVTWSSSNPAVAAVNWNGVITGVSAGTATITVTTADGDFSATSEIEVRTIPITSMTLPETSAVNIGEAVTLIAVILPENATNRNVTWSSNNTSVATVSNNGEVTGVSVGAATITATTQDGGFTAMSVITVSPPPLPMIGCNSATPGWGAGALGAGFASANTWTVGSGANQQTWSDAVVAAACVNRTTFNGGTVNSANLRNSNFNADCRNSVGNNNFRGHYFSWCAVMRFADELCPPAQGWRVPTSSDFAILHQNLGSPSIPWNTYAVFLSPNGGVWGGSAFTGHALVHTLGISYYWSSTESSTTSLIVSPAIHAYRLSFTSTLVTLSLSTKNEGFALRCVRN